MTQFVVFRSHLGVAGGTLELRVPTTDALVAMGTAQELTPDGGIYQAEFDSVAVDDYVLKHINAAGKTQWIDTVRVSSASGTFLSFDVTGAPFPSEAPANWLKSVGIQDGALTADKFAASSLNGKGDWATEGQVYDQVEQWADGSGLFVQIAAIDMAVSALQSSITALNNLSAKANLFGALLLEVPDSGTRAYLYEFVVRDDEDKLVNLVGMPTVSLTNTAGADRSSLITTAIALASIGRYTFAVTVGSGTANEALRLAVTGTIGGESRYAVIMPQVVDYDSATQINTILSRIGTPSVSLAADIATRLATSAYTAPDNAGILAAKTAAESVDGKWTAPRLAKIDGAAQTGADNDTLKSLSDQLDGVNSTASTIATGVANLLLKFTGMTSLADWIRRFVRKDAGTTGMATAQSEINTGGTSTFDGPSHSIETLGSDGGSGTTSEFTGTALDQINELRGLIQASDGATLLTTVRPGGKLALKAGDDYIASETYTVDVPIDDAAETAYALLTRSQTASIKFGASRKNSNKSDQIVGTASKAAVYKNAGKTYVPVEILGSQLTNLVVGDNWRYDIQVTSQAAKKRTVCTGDLEIEQDYAT